MKDRTSDNGIDCKDDEPSAPERPAHKTDHENWPEETGGPKGPEPTRYGDWERKGRVSDF